MMTHIIDGRRVAAALQQTIQQRIARLDYQPVLKVIIVGQDPASEIYVRNKTSAAFKVGIRSQTITLAATITEGELIEFIYQLIEDDNPDGVIVQLPLPAHIRTSFVLEAISPARDVDGFHPLNVGWLSAGRQRNVPCTPHGIIRLLEAAGTPLHGVHAVIVGTGPIVGRPLSTLLLQAGATVTLTNRNTRDLAAETRRADIIVVAAGCPNLLRGAMITAGVTIIDVGINRLANGKICGDVNLPECLGIARAITPVPGGVGPMTVACLLENTLKASLRLRGLQDSDDDRFQPIG